MSSRNIYVIFSLVLLVGFARVAYPNAWCEQCPLSLHCETEDDSTIYKWVKDTGPSGSWAPGSPDGNPTRQWNCSRQGPVAGYVEKNAQPPQIGTEFHYWNDTCVE